MKVFTILHVQSFLNIKAENLIHKVKDRALSGQQLHICEQRREMHSPVYYSASVAQFNSSFVYIQPSNFTLSGFFLQMLVEKLRSGLLFIVSIYNEVILIIEAICVF